MAVVNDDFWSDLVIAGVGALLGFLSSYLLWQLSKRREVHRQLSYDLDQQLALPSTAGGLADHVSVSYDGSTVANLYFVTLTIANTGNSVVQNQRIRLNSPDATLLKWILDPTPEPEFDISTEGGEAGTDLTLLIGHLERRQSVTIKVALSASSTPLVKLVPYNPNGDVDFISRSLKTRDDELAPVRRAVALAGAILIAPGLVRPLPAGDYIAAALQIAFTIALIPYSSKTIKEIALRISGHGKLSSVNHGLWVASGHVEVQNMHIDSTGSTRLKDSTDPSYVHPAIILLRDTILHSLSNSPQLTEALTDLADASKEVNSPKPRHDNVKELLDKVRARFSGLPHEMYVTGITATLLAQLKHVNE